MVETSGYGGVTIESAKDYTQYTVLGDSGKKTNVAAVKQGSTFIDLSSATDSFQIFGGKLSGNAGNNTLHGGMKDDTIHADNGDFVYGGGGNDLIELETAAPDSRTAERVALTSAGGKDTVKNFDTGWGDGDDIVWFYDKAAEISDVSVDSSGNMVLKQGQGQLTLKGVTSDDKIKVQDANGLYKVGYTGSNNTFTDADAAADIYLGTAKKDDLVLSVQKVISLLTLATQASIRAVHVIRALKRSLVVRATTHSLVRLVSTTRLIPAWAMLLSMAAASRMTFSSRRVQQ